MSIQGKKVFTIINPVSGNNRKRNIPAIIQDWAAKNKIDIEIQFTKKSGHIQELLSQDSIQKIDAVIVVGGDGTMNEAVQSLVHTGIPLGMIPAGSGNGFAAQFGYSTNIHHALSIIEKFKIRTIDTCLVNDARFCNVSGIGFAGEIAIQFKEAKFRGLLGYTWMIAKHINKFRPTPMHIYNDEVDIRGNYYVAEVCNGPYYGNSLQIAPPAQPDDGMMDVVLLHDIPRMKMLFKIPWMFTKKWIYGSYVTYFRTKKIQIDIQSAIGGHIDGEGQMMGTQLTYQIDPQSLKIITAV